MSAVAIHGSNASRNSKMYSAEPPNVCLETSMGKVVIELYWHHAPKTCRYWLALGMDKLELILNLTERNFVMTFNNF